MKTAKSAPVLSATLLLFASCSVPAARNGPGSAEGSPPNVVIFFTDDQGYGDLSCYGHPTIRTPHLDTLAAGGMKLTQFYVASPVCSPSRAALLTGCYPKRVGMHEHVVFPPDAYGLHPDEETLAEILKRRGYATGCFGKWHLGHHLGLLPTDQGFDTFFGVPYSNDMAQFHRKPGNKYRFRFPLMRGTEVIEWEPDQSLLTRRSIDEAVSFVENNAGGPFFAYVPFSMPHIPIYASEEHRGRSSRGLYGDVIEEIDDGVGRLVAALERTGVLEETLVIFTSDNGPWLSFKEDGGTAGPLRGGKGTNFEGGQRVPFLACWPGKIAPGRVETAVVSSMDLVPTISALAGASLPAERPLDGRDLHTLFLNPTSDPPADHPFLYYAAKGPLAGIRYGPWKLLLKSGELYHLEHDISEQWNLAEAHPDRVRELRALAESLDNEITANARPVKVEERTYFDPVIPGAESRP